MRVEKPVKKGWLGRSRGRRREEDGERRDDEVEREEVRGGKCVVM